MMRTFITGVATLALMGGAAYAQTYPNSGSSQDGGSAYYRNSRTDTFSTPFGSTRTTTTTVSQGPAPVDAYDDEAPPPPTAMGPPPYGEDEQSADVGAMPPPPPPPPDYSPTATTTRRTTTTATYPAGNVYPQPGLPTPLVPPYSQRTTTTTTTMDEGD